MRIGDKFKVKETGHIFTLLSIETKKRTKAGIITLKDPVYILQQDEKEDLRIYQSELERLISWGRWETINN